MNELTVTVTGWVATDPKLHLVPGGTDLVSFRLASTSRYFDRSSNQWIDRETEWFTVRIFRAAAFLIQRSVRKGQPVVVVGRLHSNEWQGNEGQRVDLVIDAATVGHDLTRGIAEFSRAVVDGITVKLADSGAAGGSEAEPVEPASDEPLDESEVVGAAEDEEAELLTTGS